MRDKKPQLVIDPEKTIRYPLRRSRAISNNLEVYVGIYNHILRIQNQARQLVIDELKLRYPNGTHN